ncbi:MAG: glycosyltransferase family 87 protein [Zavarzinella sp.]
MSIKQWPLSVRILWQLIAIFVLWMQIPVREHVSNGQIKKTGWLYQLQPPLNETANDFFQEWSSARNWWNGHGIYDHMSVNIQRYGNSNLQVNDIQYNAHPPFSIAILLPLGLLNYHAALAVWHVASAVMLGLSIILLTKISNWKWQSEYYWLALPILAILSFCNPIRQQFSQGQLNALLLLLIVCAWSASKYGRYFTFALFIGIAAACKVFPGFLLIYLLLRCRYKAFIFGVIIFVMCNIISGLLFGFSNVYKYIDVVIPSLKTFRYSWMNQSILGVWHRLFIGSQNQGVIPIIYHTGLAWLATIVTFSIFVVIIYKKSLEIKDARSWDRFFWMLITIMLLLGPITWDHSLVLLIPSLLVYLKDIKLRMFPKDTSILSTCLLVLFCLGPNELFPWFESLGVLTNPATPFQQLVFLNIPCYCLLLFLALQLRHLKRMSSGAERVDHI